jgi:hypothetical protein
MPSPRNRPTPTQQRHDLGLSGAVYGVIPPAEQLPPSGGQPGPNSQRVREASPGVHGGTAGMLERRDPDGVAAERADNEAAAKNAEKARAKADKEVEAARQARRDELAAAEKARAEAQPIIDAQAETPEPPAEPEPEPEPDDDDLSNATRDELYVLAQELDIAGRSSLTRDELEAAVREARAAAETEPEENE